MTPSAAEVREYVLGKVDQPLREGGWDPAAIGDDFDLLEAGVIDSLGVVELIVDVSEHFGLEVDLDGLDPEGLTLVGPLSRYVAEAGESWPRVSR